MKKGEKKKSSILLIIIFFVGLSLLLYPSFSNYWNSFHQSRAIASYAEAVAAIDDGEYEKMWSDAVRYNQKLYKKGQSWTLTDKEKDLYNSLLNIDGTGIMGYVEIPKINLSLPVYHGVDASVLQIAIGHLEGSSLPVGGEGSHCVISGHRGLPSARLFTNLDRMKEGDVFLMKILDETLAYEVDQIRIVEPEDTSNIRIEEGKDYCTLVTCTPYGINTHRLLVRGHRIDSSDLEEIRVSADAIQIEPVIVAPVLAIPILFILLIWLLIYHRKR